VDNPHFTGHAIDRAEQRVDIAVRLVREAHDGLAAHLRKHPDSHVNSIPLSVRQALSDALTSYDDVNGLLVRVRCG
jgi:hypothetical protein